MSGAEGYRDAVFGENAGYVAVALGIGPHMADGKLKHRDWQERSILWPSGRAELLALTEHDGDVYVCPGLRTSPGRRGYTRPEGTNAAPLAVLWADLDGATDEALLESLDPLVVSSGRGRHVYPLLAECVSIEQHRALNRALAEKLGGDHKWSDESLLRLPDSHNHKTSPPTPVTVTRCTSRRWPIAELAALLGVDLNAPLVEQVKRGGAGDLQPEDPPDPLPAYVAEMLANEEVPESGRSGMHHRVVGACREAGLTLGQTLSVCLDYPVSLDKYAHRTGGVALQVERSWDKIGPTETEKWANYTLQPLPQTVNGQAPPPGVEPGANQAQQQPLNDQAPPPVPPPSPGPPGPAQGTLLPFQWFDELAAEVDTAPPRQWLIRNVWPAGDYGMLSAPPKAQKTWCATDLAVSVAAGKPWLGHKPVDVTGPVIVFVGEGGKGNAVRRIRAVAAEKGVPTAGLQIMVCARAPHLKSTQHLAAVERQVAEIRPALVIIDPLYLAARGANLADLYAMGEVLENIQAVCQRHGASLMLVHHFNRNTAVTGAARNAGAGPQEWARVLLSVEEISRRQGERPGESVVVTKLEAQGGEIPDQSLTITRRVWADDSDDLGSALHVITNVSANEMAVEVDGVKISEGQRKFLAAMAKAERPETITGLVDIFAGMYGNGLHETTVNKFLARFQERGWAEHEPWVSGSKEPKRWALTETGRQEQSRRSETLAQGSPLINGEDPNSSTYISAGQEGVAGVAPGVAHDLIGGPLAGVVGLYREADPAASPSATPSGEDPQKQEAPGSVEPDPTSAAPVYGRSDRLITAVPPTPDLLDMSPETRALMEQRMAQLTGQAPAPATNGSEPT